MFVYLAAVAYDLAHASADAELIAKYAATIPAEQIPRDTFAAARELVKSFHGNRHQQWMIRPRQAVTIASRLKPTVKKTSRRPRKF